MNLASWIVLLVVMSVVVLALRATFSKKKSSRGCCNCTNRESCAGCPVDSKLPDKLPR